MKLYGAPPSPYWRKTRIVAAELGLLDQIEEIVVQTSPMDAPPLARKKATRSMRIRPAGFRFSFWTTEEPSTTAS